MLTPQQQQELINVAKIFDPLFLWSGSLDEYAPLPSPSTQSFILQKINNQNIMQKAIGMTTMPLYLPNESYIITLLDHAYLNLNFEKQLFLNGSNVTFDISNPLTRPVFKLNWDYMSFLPNLFTLAKQMLWVWQFFMSDKYKKVGAAIEDQVTTCAAHVVIQNTLEAIDADLDILISCILAIEFLDSILEQYVKEFIKTKYLYSWDSIESYYWQQYRQNDLFYLSTSQINDVNMGKKTKQEYLKMFGNRGAVDFELLSPRFLEVQDTVFTHSQNTQETIEEKTINESVIKNLTSWDRKLMEASWTMKSLRGTIRVKSLACIAHLRWKLLEISKEQTIGSDLIFFMTKEEILKDPKLFIEQAAVRKEQYTQNIKINLPTLTTREVIAKLTISHEKGEKVTGTPVSGGQANGSIVYVSTTEMEPTDLDNAIAVFPDASPAFSTLYRHAKGIVFQTGGAMSHGAIVAREYRIPAITLGGHELGWEAKTNVQINGTEGTLVIV